MSPEEENGPAPEDTVFAFELHTMTPEKLWNQLGTMTELQRYISLGTFITLIESAVQINVEMTDLQDSFATLKAVLAADVACNHGGELVITEHDALHAEYVMDTATASEGTSDLRIISRRVP